MKLEWDEYVPVQGVTFIWKSVTYVIVEVKIYEVELSLGDVRTARGDSKIFSQLDSMRIKIIPGRMSDSTSIEK